MHITFKQANANALNVCVTVFASKKNHDFTFDVEVSAGRITPPLLS